MRGHPMRGEEVYMKRMKREECVHLKSIHMEHTTVSNKRDFDCVGEIRGIPVNIKKTRSSKEVATAVERFCLID
jgi:hypothetical protein